MRNVSQQERVRIQRLKQLDALVAQHVTGEEPERHWEDEGRNFRFSSLEEALEAMHDPELADYMPPSTSGTVVVNEVTDYPPYSSELVAAWRLVGCFHSTLHIREGRGGWVAAFGVGLEVSAQTAPLAICLAALRARGVEVEFDAQECFSSED